MPIAMPNTSNGLTYSIVAAIAITILAAVVAALAGTSNLVAAVLTLALAAVVYRLIGRHQARIVRAGETAAVTALLCVLCALADLVSGFPYQAVLLLLAAAALGFAFLLLQQGTAPVALRLGGISLVAPQDSLAHLRMLEELRDAGILTADEFAAKRTLVEP